MSRTASDYLYTEYCAHDSPAQAYNMCVFQQGAGGENPRSLAMADRQKPAYDAFSVEEREGAEKPYFRNIGAAWATKSGEGLNLTLQVLPINGRILLLPYKERPPAEPK